MTYCLFSSKIDKIIYDISTKPGSGGVGTPFTKQSQVQNQTSVKVQETYDMAHLGFGLLISVEYWVGKTIEKAEFMGKERLVVKIIVWSDFPRVSYF
ncbi:hypothetical protein IMG5_150760 [Ichthyophthirius multifiliis]|uniref:Uncharacterized protein n=1 Tax=Ichthyophthirius multifiliis TaxID=5932 RepID=G0QYM4_ICHMU|nr:hypothetical protein IMG5_150760 [Ichthyophthirius multifiliis]EGR29680.1 hypothetical protein IMG5_150760 [Ichthyophthirius multifiliis]|eukprot:XP_004030916.1 hypothetical protein IMG5_150760 [Ichthyophthirius multifiliis]